MNIRTRIFFIVLSTLSIGIICSFIVAERDLTNRLEKQILSELQKQGNLILTEVSTDPDFFNKTLKNRADNYSQATNSRITFINSLGEVIADSDLEDSGLAGLDNHFNRPEVIQASQQGFGWSRRYSETLQTDMLYFAIKADNLENAYFVRISVPYNYFSSVFDSLNNSILLIAVVALIVAILASILAGNYTRDNLIELESVASNLAKKKYKKKELKALPINRGDEIGSVARTISAISTNLKDQISILAKQRDQFGNVLDDIGQGIMVFDKNGVVTYANDESHNILNVESLVNLTLDEIPSKPIKLLFDQAGKKGKFAMEFEIDSMGENRWILAQMNRSKSTGEKILVLHDETQLRHLDSMRRDFISNLSHELRTPVSVIKANSETLLDGALDSKEDAATFSSAILHNADRLTEMVNSLIDLSRIEYGELKFNSEYLVLRNEIHKIIERFLPVLKKKNINIEFDYSSNLKVYTDQSALERVLNNFIDNAIKYSNPNSTIIIKVRRKKSHARIAITDEGIGIDDLEKKHVFSRFYRTAKARAETTQGSGLGLAITKHLVNQMHGEVGVVSNQDVGSTFWFTVPLTKKDFN